MRLTDIAVRALKAPDQGQKVYADDSLPGFGVRVSQGGTKTFVVLHGPTRERITVGRFPILSLSEARTEAKRILAERTLGKHRPKTVSFDEAKAMFLDNARAHNRPNTYRDYRRLLKRFSFGRTKLGDIAKRDVKKKLDKLSAVPSEQRHALAVIKIFFNWAVREDYLEHSPCEGLRPSKPYSSRARALSAEELRELLGKALVEPYPFGPIVVLMILTGQRRTEIAHLEWEWISRVDSTIGLPATITKNKRQHTLPYGGLVSKLLDTLIMIDNAQYLFPAARSHVRGKPTSVFNGWGKAKQDFDKKLVGVKPYTLHDLRRTFSTHMAALGVAQIVVEKLLNHISQGTQSPIAQVYNRHTYLAEMREAVKVWEAYLIKLTQRQ